MRFTDKIKQLRIQNNYPQRKVAAILEIDTATYSKIENGFRKASKAQVFVIAKFFKIDAKELINLWTADKVYNIISGDCDVNKVFRYVSESIKEYRKVNN